MDCERDVLLLCMFWQYRSLACTLCSGTTGEFDWEKTRWNMRRLDTSLCYSISAIGKAGKASSWIGKGIRVIAIYGHFLAIIVMAFGSW